MNQHDKVRQIAQTWVTAYNEKDYARLRALLADDFILLDLGLDLTIEGGGEFVDGISAVATTDIPDRKITVKRIMVDGDVAIIESSWKGTVLVERWGKPPGSIRQHTSCTVLEIRGDQIVRMTDYTCELD